MKKSIIYKALALPVVLSSFLFGTEVYAADATQQPSSVAYYNGQYYDTVQEAVDDSSGQADIKLIKNTTERFALVSGKNITFDLNGYTLTSDDAGSSVIDVNTGGTLILKSSDSAGVGKVTGGSSGIYNSGNLTLESGYISGNSGTYGGGIYNDGTCTINGGEISGNMATNYGGGIYSSGTLTINKGKISGNSVTVNKSTPGGGIFVVTGGTCTIKNAVIYQNKDLVTNLAVSGGVGLGPTGSVTMDEAASAAIFNNVGADFVNEPSVMAAYDDVTVKLSNHTFSGAAMKWLNNGLAVTNLTLDKKNYAAYKSEVELVDQTDVLATADTFIAGNIGGGIVSNGYLYLNGTKDKYTIYNITSINWVDNDDEKGNRPSYVTVDLTRNGVVYRTIPVTKAKNWAGAFDAVPTYDSTGTKYIYAIAGQDEKYYTPKVNTLRFNTTTGAMDCAMEYTLKTAPTPVTVSVEASLTWDDSNNADTSRPDSVDIQLLKDGSVVETVTVTASEDWKHTFTEQKYVLDSDGWETEELYKYTMKVPDTIPLYNTTYTTPIIASAKTTLKAKNAYTGNDAHPITIAVTDASGNPIVGAEVDILNSSDTTIHSGTTGSDGKFKTNVAAGTYKLKQQTAPTGYIVNTKNFSFVMAKNADVTGTTKIIDDVVRVYIKRIDSGSGDTVEGAKLKLRDSNGTTVAEWTSETTGYNINGKLAAGEKYYLVETEAPDGYKQAKEVTFTTKTTGETLDVTIGSAKTSTESDSTAKTTSTTRTASPDDSTVSGNKASGSTSSKNTTSSEKAAAAAAAKENEEEKAKRTGDAKTGDESMLALYICGSVASLAILVVCIVFVFKKIKENKQMRFLAGLKDSIKNGDEE